MDKPPSLPAPAPSNEEGSPRSEILERAAHDLKNPLAVVRSALEWLEIELGDREGALDAIRDASTAAVRILTIVDDLDALARLERAVPIASTAIELSELVGRVTAAAALRLAARGMTVVACTPRAMPGRGDADLLARSIHALIDACARGATAGTCIEIEARLVGGVGAEPSAQVVEIEIGQRGTVPAGPETSAIEALASGGLGVYVAVNVAKAHHGAVAAIPTTTMPRALLRIPR